MLGIVSLKATINIFLTLFATFDKELQRQAHVDDRLVTVNVNHDASDDSSVDINADEPANKKKAKSKYKWIDAYNFEPPIVGTRVRTTTTVLGRLWQVRKNTAVSEASLVWLSCRMAIKYTTKVTYGRTKESLLFE
jgi:hypothetical protein